jgi:acyl-CoA thioester hydrolase
MPFQLTLRVTSDDIDQHGHVNNITYLRWVQDIATAHWQELASTEEQTGILWVVLRHEIDYQFAAVEDDELLIRTRLGQARGLTFERHVDVLRVEDQRLLVRARTLWCPLNPHSRRPQRLPARLRALFSAAETEHN